MNPSLYKFLTSKTALVLLYLVLLSCLVYRLEGYTPSATQAEGTVNEYSFEKYDY